MQCTHVHTYKQTGMPAHTCAHACTQVNVLVRKKDSGNREQCKAEKRRRKQTEQRKLELKSSLDPCPSNR